MLRFTFHIKLWNASYEDATFYVTSAAAAATAAAAIAFERNASQRETSWDHWLSLFFTAHDASRTDQFGRVRRMPERAARSEGAKAAEGRTRFPAGGFARSLRVQSRVRVLSARDSVDGVA